MPDDCAFSAASVTAANLNLRFFGTTDVFDGWLTVYNVDRRFESRSLRQRVPKVGEMSAAAAMLKKL
jgi:hypothetical protein